MLFFCYYCGRNWNKIEQNIDKTKCCNAIVIIGAMVVLRVVRRVLLDDTSWYDLVIVILSIGVAYVKIILKKCKGYL